MVNPMLNCRSVVDPADGRVHRVLLTRALSVGSRRIEPMFETPDAEAVRRVTAALAAESVCMDDGERVAEIRALEELKCAAEARQATLAVGLTESKATALEVALARRESHHGGRRHLGLARVVSRELPHTWAAWRAVG